MAVKKYPKLVQCDKRGQIVIPKDIRRELKIDEGTGFWMYTVTDEGILLKKIDTPSFGAHSEIVRNIEEKSDKLKIKKSSVKKTLQKYKKTTEGGLDVI
ncbi:AbrB/MazE/SpoVT family DNA-binding domain-containing protein [Candidatus Woesearchaeota archaeon]|nr:AbrB/MazE/SpoVT family DNA-binding domain-containing protein [Candidatus Woesearchaeota archaeon]